MQLLIIGIALTALIASQLSYATDIKTLILPYFQQRLAGLSDEINVEIKTNPKHHLRCEDPQLSTPGNSRLWGNISVMMRCGDDKRFIQVQVQAVGHYVVVTRSVPRGSTLNAQTLTLKRGRLDTLPANVISDKEHAINAITLRDITPDVALTSSMIRQPWRIKAGQSVRVIANGEGFSVNSEGRALNNVAVGQHARARMDSGLIVSGKLDADGNILIKM